MPGSEDSDETILDFLQTDRIANCISATEKYCVNHPEFAGFYIDLMLIIIYDHFAEIYYNDDSHAAAAIIVKIAEIRALIDEVYF